MTPTVLILGSNGRLGRNAAEAFAASGWSVRQFDRVKDTLWDAAWGASVIVAGWNPGYPNWTAEIPGQTAQIIEVARASGATVILPGNVYVYGKDAPEIFGAHTPHGATDPLGNIRVTMEASFKASGVKTIVVRGGDYLDTEASGNWFDKIMITKLGKGIFTYPGALDCPHAFSYLPDVAATMVALADMRDELPEWTDVNAPSFTLTGRQLAAALGQITGREVRPVTMSWWPIQLARPFWAYAPHLISMRYLWDKPHRLDTAEFDRLCPHVAATPLHEALSRALQLDVDPDEAMRPSRQTIAAE